MGEQGVKIQRVPKALDIEAEIGALNLPEQYEWQVRSLINNIIADSGNTSVDDDTGLARRKHFETKLTEFLATKRQRGFCAVVFADMTGLKAINDTLGHQAGNMVLTIVADILANNIRTQHTKKRPEDLHARYGGDEFVSLLINFKELHHAHQACHRLMNTVRDYDWASHFKRSDLKVSIDVGAICFRVNRNLKLRKQRAHFFAQELIRFADNEMYLSKKLNKKPFTVSEPSIRYARFTEDGLEVVRQL